jgi:hypothetical protein
MQTARFDQLRRKDLAKVFEKDNIVLIWRKIVRDQLRGQDIKDLYDFYDFNFNITERAQAIRASVLSGNYKASQPLVYRIEKKFGISRHMTIPQATDALILQVLAEEIADEIIQKQPSNKAFYSRAKDNIWKPHDAHEYGLSNRQLWIKLQKTIYQFSKEKELIAVTDLSNYYDSIYILELRKVLNTYLNSRPEVLTDLLFGIIENISWHPDYLPYSGRSLPTSNLEAIRLLAHSFLFEVDKVLMEKTGDCFTRWMDDIVIGADTKKVAREAVSAISDMLKSRGLALNIAKTNIYSQEEAFFHFQINENLYLNSVEDQIKALAGVSKKYKALEKELVKRFRNHNSKNKAAKSWDKVAKRYITQFGHLKSEKILNEITKLYIYEPALRANLLIYLFIIGFNGKTSEKIMEILKGIDIFDDISLYQICSLIVEWEIPDTEEGRTFLKKFEDKATTTSFSKGDNISGFYSLLWFKAKYKRADELLEYLKKYQNFWQSDNFLRRQATALLSRLYLVDKEEVRGLLQHQVSSGEQNTVSLANQIRLFTNAKTLDPALNFYLFPTKPQRPYPLPKFLVLCSVLNSSGVKGDPSIREKILKHISDPFYKKWLDQMYGIS